MNIPKNYLVAGLLVTTAFLSSVSLQQLNQFTPPVTATQFEFDEQDATIAAIKRVSPAVTSIIVSEEQVHTTINLSTGTQTQTIQKVEIGTGTGFLISADGYIITNRHVLAVNNRDKAEYQIILQNGKRYFAQFIGNDPIKDLAILKIFDKDLPYVELGDSNDLVQGMTVIAMGNALGRYQNTVTKGIVSALGRSLTASDGRGNREALDNVIQTDAGINPGNSGGPLVDLNGRVVGINTAIDQSGNGIGFAIPINDAKVIIRSIREENRIVRPLIGIQYQMITPELQQEFGLSRGTGAWINRGTGEFSAILPGSPADKGGLREGDIILEINAIKVDGNNTLFTVLQNYKPGDRIGLRVDRDGKIIIIIVTLAEFK